MCSGTRESDFGYRHSQFDPSRRRAADRIAPVFYGVRAARRCAGPFEALFGGFRRHAPQPSPQETSAYADPFNTLGGESRRAGGRIELRPRHRFLCPHLRRPLLPAAAPRRDDPGRTVSLVLPRRQDHGVFGQQDRHRGRAERHPLRGPRHRLRLSRQGERRLLLHRQGGSASPASNLRRSDLAAGRHRRDRHGLSTYSGSSSKTAEFTPISTSSSEWARRLSEVKIEPRRRPSKIEPMATTTPSRSAAPAPRRRDNQRNSSCFTTSSAKRQRRRRVPAIRSRTNGSVRAARAAPGLRS